MSDTNRELRDLCITLDSLRVDAQVASDYAHQYNPRMISLIFSGLEKKLETVQSLALKIRDEEASHE